MESYELAILLARALDDKKGGDIFQLDLSILHQGFGDIHLLGVAPQPFQVVDHPGRLLCTVHRRLQHPDQGHVRRLRGSGGEERRAGPPHRGAPGGHLLAAAGR